MESNGSKKNITQEKAQTTQIFFGGDAQCGLFGITEDYSEDYLSLDELVIKDPEATFFLKAKGDSMAPLIQENDVLVVDRSETIKSNQVVILCIHGEMICKRLVKRAPHIFLYSEGKQKPILVTEEMEMIVFGKVSAILRIMP